MTQPREKTERERQQQADCLLPYKPGEPARGRTPAVLPMRHGECREHACCTNAQVLDEYKAGATQHDLAVLHHRSRVTIRRIVEGAQRTRGGPRVAKGTPRSSRHSGKGAGA